MGQGEDRGFLRQWSLWKLWDLVVDDDDRGSMIFRLGSEMEVDGRSGRWE